MAENNESLGSAEAYLRRGTERFERGDFDGAIADFSEYTRLRPDDAAGWYKRGNAWSYKRNYDKAIADYTEVIRINPPRVVLAWNNRGNAWLAKGEHDNAIADFDEAIRLNPNIKEAIHNRAVALALKASESKREELAMTITNTEKLREHYEKNMSISEGCEKQAKYILWGFGIILLSYLGWIACNTIMIYETTDTWNPFQIIPWLSLAAVGSVPFLLWYRLVQQRRFESLALSYAFLRKLIVEERISLYSADDPELRKQLLKLYTLHWMDKSPLEALLAIGGKKDGAGGSASSIAELLREMEKTLPAKSSAGKDGSG